MTVQLVDIGVNLHNHSFDQDRDEVIERAIEQGVTTMILTGTSLGESQQALEFAQAYPEHCFSTAGVHPHVAKEVNAGTFVTLKSLLADPKVVAVGETGLDFNRDFSPRPLQEWVFEQQLALAEETALPLFCHERDAAKRFADIVAAHRDHIGSLVVHCFTADKKALFRYLDLDCHIGITGWVCDERRGTHLHPLLHNIPANRLMVETDAPWLLPKTLTEKPKNRRNEPAFLPEVVKTIARVVAKPVAQVAEETRKTAQAFFNLAVDPDEK